MSYNRGYQQGGGPPYRSNLLQNMGQRTMVSPWECGVVPNSRSQIQNVLPVAQSPVNSNMLAQQHALAVASNLLSTLGMLPQQQQQHQQQELPSLLNLAGLGNSNALQYRQQPQNFGRGAMNNRFNTNLGSVRRKQEQNTYRTEPYNKNRGRQTHVQQTTGQHHQQGRGRYPQFSKTHPDRKPGAAAVRASDKTPASSKGLPDLRLKLQKPVKEQGDGEDGTENVNDETVAKDPDSISTEKKTVEESHLISDISMEEEAKRDDEDEGKTKKKNKRDWKDEKKIDIIASKDDVPEASDEMASADELQEIPNNSAKEDVDGLETKKKVGENDKRESKNADKVFACHVCDRTAQGELAFVRHMNSKPHKIAVETLNEQYKIEADGMRRNMQTDVRLEELQIEKLKRMGKTGRTAYNRDYCKMCDLHFYGSLPAHRRNKKHLELKTFLHPRCIPCDKEFPTRLEWDNHNLSILHQLRVVPKTENSQDSAHVGIRSVLESPTLKSPEPEDGADLTSMDVDVNIQYDPTHCYGLEVTIPGFHCKVCEVFFQKKGEHCKTKNHFNNWLQYKAKEKEAADIAKKTIEAEALAEQQSTTSDPVVSTIDADLLVDDPDGSDTPKDDNEGNWKRRRVETAEDEEDDDSEVVELSPVKRERNVPLVQLDETPPPKIADGNAPYDPIEADIESTTDGSKEIVEPEDAILEDLDEAISDILDSAQKDAIKVEVEAEDTLPIKGMRARRGRGGVPRGRRRK